MRFFTIILLIILEGCEIDLFIPGFPQIQDFFNVTPFMVEWTLSFNLCAYCISSLVMGNLSDRFGPKPMIIIGLLLFIFGSVLCVICNKFWVLLTGRVFQGIGVAAPAVLAYVIIADEYPLSQQKKLFGMITGIMTLAMAFAPLIGSYINIYTNWRGSFIALLVFSVICLVLSIKYLAHRSANKQIEISFRSYSPILRSQRTMLFILVLCFIIEPYWVYVGMTPIIFMEGLNVSLENFAFYQASTAAAYCVGSFASKYLLEAFGERKCFMAGIYGCILATILIAIIGILQIQSALLITICASILSLSSVMPINILYPISLELIPLSKSRISALAMSIRLILTAVGLSLASYFYHGTFGSTAIVMVVFLTLFFVILKKIMPYDKHNVD